jgi:hypothetical protein
MVVMVQLALDLGNPLRCRWDDRADSTNHARGTYPEVGEMTKAKDKLYTTRPELQIQVIPQYLLYENGVPILGSIDVKASLQLRYTANQFATDWALSTFTKKIFTAKHILVLHFEGDLYEQLWVVRSFQYTGDRVIRVDIELGQFPLGGVTKDTDVFEVSSSLLTKFAWY